MDFSPGVVFLHGRRNLLKERTLPHLTLFFRCISTTTLALALAIYLTFFLLMSWALQEGSTLLETSFNQGYKSFYLFSLVVHIKFWYIFNLKIEKLRTNKLSKGYLLAKLYCLQNLFAHKYKYLRALCDYNQHSLLTSKVLKPFHET